MIYLRLFYEFAKTGLFAVGGGMATIPFLYAISEKTGWFTAADIGNMIAKMCIRDRLQEGAKQAEAAAGNMEASVGALAQAAGGVAQGAGGAAGIIENYIGSLNNNGSAAATEQANAAIVKENAAVNTQANAQQRANVAAALSAAGLTEEQQQMCIRDRLSGRLCKTSAEISYPYQGKQGNGGEVYAFGIIAAR